MRGYPMTLEGIDMMMDDEIARMGWQRNE